tara:strand:- start:1110 stop:1496 length:387 start_codon:yes stop_codon:yes gene_type:complete
MKITDLLGVSLIEIKNRIIPLKEIDYQDVQIGDIMVKLQYMDDNFSAIQITEKYIEDGGRYGNKMFTYNVYKISYGRIDENGNPIIEEILLDISSHDYSYQGLLREKWDYVLSLSPSLPTLNYPEGLL